MCKNDDGMLPCACVQFVLPSPCPTVPESRSEQESTVFVSPSCPEYDVHWRRAAVVEW